MRLLVAWLDLAQAQALRSAMEAMDEHCVVDVTPCGEQALQLLSAVPYDLCLVHAHLRDMRGDALLSRLQRSAPVCPPRVLAVGLHQPKADGRALAGASLYGLCTLLQTLQKKPLPMLAAERFVQAQCEAERLLSELGLDVQLKGRAYAAWLMSLLALSPLMAERPLGDAYALCAHAFHTSAVAVERCLRIAVESVFTQGSMAGIERLFGATVDPERGKLTNRAFLLEAAHRLRERLYSLAAERSPNKSEMHQSPAAPTSV